MMARIIVASYSTIKKRGLGFVANRIRWKEGKCCASELAGIEPSSPDPEEQGMPALTTWPLGCKLIHSSN